MYPGLNCVSGCHDELMAAAATVTVTAGLVTAGRDFALNPPLSGRVRGLITSATTSAPAPNVGVILYARVGTRYAYAGSGYADLNGRYDIGALPPGNYYAQTLSWDHQYIDEIHPDIPCVGTCEWEQGGVGAVTLGTPVSVGTAAVALNFALQPRSASRLPGQVTELAAYIANRTVDFFWYPVYDLDTRINSYVLEIGLSPRTTIVSIPVQDTRYQATGVPSGRYYARVRAQNGAGLGPASSEYRGHRQCRRLRCS